MKRITLLVDDVNSWFIPFACKLVEELKNAGNDVCFVNNCTEMIGGDISFLLSCTKLVDKKYLQMYSNNIVIHASDLPKGKGFTPMKWQVLEGIDDIVITLFEAVESVDAGDYYFKECIHFKGYELLDEMQRIMGNKICEMALKFVAEYGTLNKISQEGEETFYPKRGIEDDKLDVNLSIAEQFNHFRIADNERFPLWFQYKDHKYIIKIYSAD